jgi:cobalt/nickel transport system permease protein
MLYAPEPMHIPDGFLSVAVSLIFWVASIALIAVALRRTADIGERQVPLMGLLAACIFAGQMLNFAVTGGTSGHLLGAALATVVVGPWAAALVMACVLGVQALVFQDGGLLALGANIFNLAFVGVAVAYVVYRAAERLAGRSRWVLLAAGFAAGWTSVFVSSLAVGLQLSLSGTSPANLAIPAMAGVHAVIGVGEGLITAGALALLYAARPDLLTGGRQTGGGRLVWVFGALIALLLVALSPLASSNPDGLEWVAEEMGFAARAQAPLYEIIPDYVFPGVSGEATATIIAGVLGTALVLAAALGMAYARRRRSEALSSEAQ